MDLLSRHNKCGQLARCGRATSAANDAAVHQTRSKTQARHNGSALTPKLRHRRHECYDFERDAHRRLSEAPGWEADRDRYNRARPAGKGEAKDRANHRGAEAL